MNTEIFSEIENIFPEELLSLILDFLETKESYPLIENKDLSKVKIAYMRKYKCGTEHRPFIIDCIGGLIAIPHSFFDQPFVEDDGTQIWYRFGLLHRKGKPAIIHTDGSVEFWEEGEPYRDKGGKVRIYN